MSTTKTPLPIIRVTTENVHEYLHLQKENVMGHFVQIHSKAKINGEIQSFKSCIMNNFPDYSEDCVILISEIGYILQDREYDKYGDYYFDQKTKKESHIERYKQKNHNILLIKEFDDKFYFLDFWNQSDFEIETYELYIKLSNISAHTWRILEQQNYINEMIHNMNTFIFSNNIDLYNQYSMRLKDIICSDFLQEWLKKIIFSNFELFDKLLTEYKYQYRSDYFYLNREIPR